MSLSSLLACTIFLSLVEALNLAEGVSSSLLEFVGRLFLVLGIRKRDGARGLLEFGSLVATTTSLAGIFRDPFGLTGLLGVLGMGPWIGQISILLDLGGLEFLE